MSKNGKQPERRELSDGALNVLMAFFGTKSQISIPAGIAEEILEVRHWAEAEMQARSGKVPQGKPEDVASPKPKR